MKKTNNSKGGFIISGELVLIATVLVIGLLVGTVVVVGALTFIPALALGPIVEHLVMIGK